MEGLDIIVALDLRNRRSTDWTVRSVASDLNLPPATVHRAISRLAETTVMDRASRRLNSTELEHLLVDAVRFMFPARLGAETRGVPTAWGTAPLGDEVAADGGVPVWPSPMGAVRGFAVAPLHESALALRDDRPSIYEQLTLVDALRMGDARIRGVAARLLRERLLGTAAAA